MFAVFALLLLHVWFIGFQIYRVGGESLHLLLLLALFAVGCHVVSGRRSRLAWSRANRRHR